MWFRRAWWWIALGSILIVPAWLMFGRAFFGAPLGVVLAVQVFVVPIAALALAAMVGVTIARKEVRTPRLWGWLDIALVGGWILVALVHGFTVVDSAGSTSASALTALAGPSAETTSNVLASLSALTLIAGAPAIIIHQVVRLVRETRRRVTEFVDNLPSGDLSGGRRGATVRGEFEDVGVASFTTSADEGDVVTGTVVDAEDATTGSSDRDGTRASGVIEGTFSDVTDGDAGARGDGQR